MFKTSKVRKNMLNHAKRNEALDVLGPMKQYNMLINIIVPS